MATYEQTGVKVVGYKAAIRSLKAIGVPNKEISDAGKKSAEITKNAALPLIPVRSGRLRKSVKVKATMKGGVSIKAGNENTIPYANPIHWGWFRRNIKPQPFFVKALGITRDEVFQTYYAQMDQLLIKHSTKGTEE